MDVFVEERLALPQKEPILTAVYSSVDSGSILAVVREREVQFFDSKMNPFLASYSTPRIIKVATWAPNDTRLVIGHEDGLVAMYDPLSRELKEEAEAHSSAITRIEFSPTNKLMLSQDRDFNIVFWRDKTPVKEFNQGAPLNVVLFVNFLHERKDKIKKNVRLCFLGDKLGNITYFEEKRLEVQELCKINGSIKELFFYAKTNSVVVVTSTYYLIQFRISTEEDIVPDKKVKISMENSSENLMGLWIEPNTFVLNSKDPILKFWNVESGHSYSINTSKLVGEEGDKGRVKVVQMTYDGSKGQLILLLSNNQTVIIGHKMNSQITDEADWSVLESPYTKGIVNVTKLIQGGPRGVALLCQAGVAVFKPFKLRLLVDGAKNTKFFLRSQTQVDYFESLTEGVKTIEFAEPFVDFTVADQTVVIMNKTRELFVSTVLELISNHQKLSPVNVGSSYSFGLKKFNKLKIDLSTGEVILGRFGYLSISEGSRAVFVNYKGSVSSDFCHPEPDACFTEAIFNNAGDHFALVDDLKRIRVFQTTANSFRLLSDSVTLTDFGTLKSEATSTESGSLTTKIEKLIVDDSGDKLVILLNRQTNNLVVETLSKRTFSTITVSDPKSIERVAFSKADPRFLTIVESPKAGVEEGQRLITTYVIEDEKLSCLEVLKVSPKTHFLEANFPETYLCSQSESGPAQLEVSYCKTFQRLLQQNEGNLTLKQFTRNFCFNLITKRLSKALTELKRIEKNFDLEDFWVSLFEKSLQIKNLKMAELCLSKIKFVRGKLFSELEVEQVGFEAKQTATENERLGNLCLCFNDLEQAKQLFMEEKNYFKITEVLFLQQNYDALLQFCTRFDKSLLNYYYLKIGESHLKNQNYSDFLQVCKRAKVPRESVVRRLNVERDFEFISRLAETEGWPEAYLVLAKAAIESGNYKEARRQLEACPENRRYLVEFVLKQERNFDAAKALSAASLPNDPLTFKTSKMLGEHKESVNDLYPAAELFIKGQQYLKVIKMLQRHEESFAKNEDLRNKVIDILFNQVLQNSSHFAAGIVANYLESLGMHEKACIIYGRTGDHLKAEWIAQTYNLSHLLNTVVTSEAEINGGSIGNVASLQTLSQPIKKMPKQKTIYNAEVSVAALLESEQYERLLTALANKPCELEITEADIGTLKSVKWERRQELLKAAAKVCKKNGSLDFAVELYSELKDNVKVIKTMIKGKMIPKIIQFANFSRDELIFTLAADSLQNFPIQFKDSTFTAILNFYVKAKKYSKAIDFLRNFSVELFESGAINDCFESLEKSEKLLSRLSENDAREYSEMLKDDRAFLTQFARSTICLQEGNLRDAFNMVEDLYQDHKTALYGSCKRLIEQFLICAVKTENVPKAVELAPLVSRTTSALKSVLGSTDFDRYLRITGASDLKGQVERDCIEEDLD